jgi:hypothetical protein
MSVEATTPIFFERGTYWKDAACTQPFTDQQAAEVLYRDVRATKSAHLSESIRTRVLSDIIPNRPGMPDPYPKWQVVWSEVRAAYGPVRGTFFVALVLALWPFELALYLVIIPFALVRRWLSKLNPFVRALIVTVVLGSIALYFWNWPGLLAVCLFVWLFTLIRQNQQRRSGTG